MKRRVIFPDPEIWTRKATMTQYADHPRAADARRASAITIHHRQQNRDGLVALVLETCEAGRPTELLLALLAIHRTAILQLRSDVGLQFVGRYVKQLAAGAGQLDDNDKAADIARSARLLDAHAREDVEAISATVRAAVDAGRPTELVIRLLDLYEVLLPELSSEPGINWLRGCVSLFAAEEVEGDQ